MLNSIGAYVLIMFLLQQRFSKKTRPSACGCRFKLGFIFLYFVLLVSWVIVENSRVSAVYFCAEQASAQHAGTKIFCSYEKVLIFSV